MVYGEDKGVGPGREVGDPDHGALYGIGTGDPQGCFGLPCSSGAKDQKIGEHQPIHRPEGRNISLCEP